MDLNGCTNPALAVDDMEEEPNVPKTEFKFDDSLTALSANKQQDKFVAGGNNTILRVYKFVEGGMEETLDVAIPEDHFHVTDVEWNQFQDDIVAISASNGMVIVINIRQGRIFDNVYLHSSRATTVLAFHPENPNMMLSGSTDGSITLYDIRKKYYVDSFEGRTNDHVRDLAFCNQSGKSNQFLTACESGCIRVFDIRMNDRWITSTIAHDGYIRNMALNPREAIVATEGGMDKKIKIFNWGDNIPFSTHKLYDSKMTGKVHWRSDANHWEFFKSAAFVDPDAGVLSPPIPVAEFPGHTDIITDTLFLTGDKHRIVTCGKDGRIILQQEKDIGDVNKSNTGLGSIVDGLVAVAAHKFTEQDVEAEYGHGSQDANMAAKKEESME